MLREALERHGFEVHEAASGEQVLQALESARPDAIVLDKEMPGLSGFEVLGLIRQHDVAVPVIVITYVHGTGLAPSPEMRALVDAARRALRR